MRNLTGQKEGNEKSYVVWGASYRSKWAGGGELVTARASQHILLPQDEIGASKWVSAAKSDMRGSLKFASPGQWWEERRIASKWATNGRFACRRQDCGEESRRREAPEPNCEGHCREDKRDDVPFVPLVPLVPMLFLEFPSAIQTQIAGYFWSTLKVWSDNNSIWWQLFGYEPGMIYSGF